MTHHGLSEAVGQRLAAIEAASSDAIVCENLDGTIATWNPAAERMFGYAHDEIVGRPMELLVPADRAQEDRARRDRVISGAVDTLDARLLAKSGRAIEVALTRAPLHDAQGAAIGIVTIARDLSGQRNTERQLERTKSVLVEAQEIARLGIWQWDLVTGEVTWSDELFRLLGWAPREIPASVTALAERIPGEDLERLKKLIIRARTEGTPFALEHRLIRKDGSTRTIHGRGRAIANADGAVIRLIGTVEDITERNEMIARLVFSDRMVSVGTLAAGVAHEINNPLAYISANLDTILVAHGDPEITALAAEAREGVERIRKVVRGLQAFSRADDDQRTPLDVDAVLELALGITSGELRHRARVVRELGGTPPVLADEARLGQVFINLLVNASEAIPEGHADRNEIRVVTRTDGAGWARIAIHDTGGGIPPEVRGRIFDPFFTTKPVGSGIGLGLSICHGIVRSLGGEITFESEPGRGSVFHVALPPANRGAAPRRTRPTSGSASQRRGTVLIVDDEEILANSLRRLLSREHTVTVVTSGRAAFERLRTGERYDVILCDLMMPELTGMDLHARVHTLSPEQADRMIFMTGGAFSATARQFLDRIANLCFEKPCDLAALRAAIRERVG